LFDFVIIRRPFAQFTSPFCDISIPTNEKPRVLIPRGFDVLSKNQFGHHDLFCDVTNAVYCLHPRHLICGF
jgi:hypothetical protein